METHKTNWARLDYVTINKGLKTQMRLLIGGWLPDGTYHQLNRDELEWHLVSRCWDDDPHDRYNRDSHVEVKRPRKSHEVRLV